MDELDPRSARKEAVKDMKRELIMDAAVKVIARDGYSNVRLEDIAEEAGFSKASIYHYFPDKEALFINIVIREQRITFDRCSEIMARDLPFLDAMREFALAAYERFFLGGRAGSICPGPGGAFAPSPSVLSSIVVSMTKHEDLFKASIQCKVELHNLFTRLVRKAKDDGVLTIPVSDEVVCAFIISFFQTLIMENMTSCSAGDGGKTEKFDINKSIDDLFTFFNPWINDARARRNGNA